METKKEIIAQIAAGEEDGKAKEAQTKATSDKRAKDVSKGKGYGK